MNDQQDISHYNDQPLPIVMVRKFGGWTAKAQNYPVFSPTWFRYRAMSFMAPLAFFALVMAGAAAFSKDLHSGRSPEIFYLEVLASWLSFALLFFLGRWLAMLAYKRHWSTRNEVIGITVGLMLGAVVATAANESADFIESRQMQSSTGGTQTPQASGAAANPAGAKKVSTEDKTFTINSNFKQFESGPPKLFGRMIWCILVVWWGGPLDLLAYFRQRRLLRDALVQQELERAKAGRNEAEVRLSVLAAQIEPHFLFNTLTGVRAAIRSDPARGIAIIDHLVDYLRATIPQMRSDANQSQVLLEPQLDAARAYLGVMAARLPRLSYSVDCDPALLNQPVPPLMLISLVENAVKHGIEPKPGQVHIAVSARKIDVDGDARLELSVTDDGVGFSGATSGSGIGLANIRERLAQLYGKRAELVLKARAEGGVVASIALPVA